MMTIKKNNPVVYLLSVMVLVVLTAGCNDLLDQTPRGQETQANFFVDAEDAIAATNATYQIQGNFSFGFQVQGMTDMASDDADKGSTPSDGPQMREMDEFTFDDTNPNFLATWRNYYDAIFRANQGITNIPNIDMDENLRARLVGENKFLRAFYYFFLVRSYGGVPLIDRPLTSEEFDVPRSSADSIYAFIEQDLRDAIKVLPVKSAYPVSELGRATRGAAQGLLAKVHLFQNEFQEAENFANQVITSGEYSLLPDYRNIFTEVGENSSESLYELQSVALETGEGGNAFALPQGVRGQPNLGFGFNNPSDDLLNTYEPGDPRLGATSLFIYETLPSGESVVRENVNVPGDERYNQKYTIPPSNPGGNGNSGANVRRLRYSDIVLMAAEAGYQNGNENNARMLLNQVRQRARNGQEATLGMEVESLSSLLADSLELDASVEGSPIARYVTSGGAAAQAGLNTFEFGFVDINPNLRVYLFQNLDIIESINGTEINNVNDYQNFVRSLGVGQTLAVTIRRISETYNESSGNVERTSQSLQFDVTAEALLPDVTASGQDLLEAIWKERRIELAMEQQRLFDLRRQDRLAEVLGDLGINVMPKHQLYPIPQEEIDLGGYEQNDGYN